MVDPQPRLGWLVDLGQFGAWILVSVGAIADALYLRSATQAILQALQLVEHSAYRQKGGIGIDLQFGFALTAIDEFLLLIFGCTALAFIIAIEYYFRRGRPQGLLLKRFIRVVVIEVIIFVLALLILTFL